LQLFIAFSDFLMALKILAFEDTKPGFLNL